VHSVLRAAFISLILAVLGAGLASAQTIDFNLLATSNGQTASVPNDFTVPIIGEVGTQTSATIVATYAGLSQATISNKPTLLGSTELTVSVPGNVTFPVILAPGQTFTYVVTYAPTNANIANAQVEVAYTEPGTTGSPVSSAIVLLFSGTAPVFTLSYIFPPPGANNIVPLQPGGTIPFPGTLLNATTIAQLNVSDTGSGQGTITDVSITTSSVFKLSGKPLFPYTLASDTSLPLEITYTPTAVETDTAAITISYQGGATATVNLMGSGITSTFTYKYLVGGTSTTVTPGGTITFPGANIGSTSGLIVQVTNTGSATGAINSVSTQGPFTLTNPISLPATLTTGNSFSVPLTFTPTEVGTQTGEVLIGNDFFVLSGQGLGSNLTYAYTSGGVNTPVNPATGGAVLFSSISVGKSEQVVLTITNSGSLPATISIIGTTPTNGPFTVSASPKTLAPGDSFPVTITFTPSVEGISNGTLVVNTTSIPLVGSGTAPPALPSYTLSGPSGSASPASQSNVSLTLSQGYAADLTGTLTITTEGTLGSDPNVQFAPGGRTVNFTIPANSTSADFAGEGSQIPLQTGTIAETVTLVPTFATTAGVDLTPSSPSTLQFTIPSLAPVIETMQLTDESTDGFDLVLVGYSTTRSLSSLSVTFTAAKGFNLGTTQFSIDLSQVSAVWFQSSASTAFGGEFQITTPFTLQGTVKAPQTPLEAIASVAATVSNDIGPSGSIMANVQ